MTTTKPTNLDVTLVGMFKVVQYDLTGLLLEPLENATVKI